MMKMAESFFNFEVRNNDRRRRIRALRMYDIIPIVVIVVFFLYLVVFFSIVRMVMRNGRIIAPDDDFDLYLNETHFDLSFLKSKSEYTTPADEPLIKSNLKINNNGESLNQSGFHLVSLASADPPSVPPTPPPPSQHPNDTTFPPPPPSLTQRQIQEQQLNNILEALIGAGDFVGWANLLSSADLSSLPVTATFFIPGNNAMLDHETVTAQNLDPLLIAYHIIPQRLSFSDLQQFKLNTRIPTLLPSKYIVITSNSLSNFTIDGSRITYPDLYVNPAFTVHGVERILEYSVYGADPLFSPPVKSPLVNHTVPDDANVAATSEPLKPKSVLPSFFPGGGRGFVSGSDSNIALAIEKLMIISVFLGVSSSFLL